MISIYTGMCGSGKSLHATKTAYNFIKRQDLVISNYPLNTNSIKGLKNDYFFYIPNQFLNNPFILINIINLFLKSYPKKRVLIIIDEAHVLFDSRRWNVKGRNEWLEFFATHRHFNTRSDLDVINVLLITQNIDTIDKRIRGICEFETKHLNITNFKTIGVILGFIFGSVIYYRKLWLNLRKNNVADYGLILPLKKYTNLYDTLSKDFM